MNTKKRSSKVRIGCATDRRADVEGEGLEQEAADHEGEPQEPHPPAEGVGEEAELHGGRFGGVLYPHALKDAAQRVRKRGPECEYVDHLSPPNPTGVLYESRQLALS